MNEWPPELGARAVIVHMANAQRLRREARAELLRALFKAMLSLSRLRIEQPHAS
jgi:hypothetical protein